MMKAAGFNMTYNQRRAELATILDMMYSAIAQKLQITPDKVGPMVKELSLATGITTTDMRLLLLLDDWKDTIKKVVVKGAEAFKDIIPFGA